MQRHTPTTQGAKPRTAATRRGRAFTMIEILVVILILGILATLGATYAVSLIRQAGREATIGYQRVILQAIEAYREQEGDFPLDDGLPDDRLYHKLITCRQAKDILRKLPDDVMTHDAGGNFVSFVDNYGTAMTYERYGGRGGTPMLVSAGADRSMGTEDDIRSDEQ